MKRIYLFIFIGLFLISFVNAEKEICIDFDEPSAPANLEVTSSGTNIILTWDAATDEPSCSGIETYNIYKDTILIATTSSDTLTYTDNNVAYGTYSYSVNAVDKVGYNNGTSIKNDVVLSEPTDEGDSSDESDSSTSGSTTVSGGGGSSSYVCSEDWDCSYWSVCEDGTQTRTCEDIEKCGTTKDKPITSQDCNVNEENNEEPLEISYDEDRGVVAGITGGVIGFAKTGRGMISIIFVLGIAGAFVARTFRKRK